MDRRRFCTQLSALPLALALGACSRRGPLKLGFIGGLSGKFADLGIAERNGALWAIDRANAKGGVQGSPIELIEKDDGHDKARAAAALRELADVGVLAVIGPPTSSIGVALAPLAQELELLLMSPTATTASLTGKDDFLVRVCNDAATYGAAAGARYIRQTGAKRVAMIADLANADYSLSWCQAFRTAASSAGAEVAPLLQFRSTEQSDLPALAKQLLASQPQLIAIGCSAVDTALLMQYLRQRNTQVQLAGCGWASALRTLELAGAAAEGSFFEQYIDFFSSAPAYLQFASEYQERFRQKPGYAEALGADAALLLIAALQAGATRATMKQQLIKRPHEALQGTLTIDAQGDTQRPVHFTWVKDGRFQALPH